MIALATRAFFYDPLAAEFERQRAPHHHCTPLAKFTVLGEFAHDELPGFVPPAYRGLVRHAAREAGVYTVILFPHDRTHGGVSTSALVRRALSRVPVNVRLLAVGADFTREATELLQTRGAAIARLGEFGWTDATYIGIRTPER